MSNERVSRQSVAWPLTLYGNKVSGHSYKVALFLSLVGAAYEYKEIDIFLPPQSRGEEFSRLSRHSEVPLLLFKDQAIVQSNAILIRLSQHFAGYFPNTKTAQSTVLEWLFWEQSRLSLGIANLRFLSLFQPDAPAALVTHYQNRSLSALAELENALSTKPFIAGRALTIADIACAGYMFWLSDTGIDPERYPHIRIWLDLLSALPGWQPPSALLGVSRLVSKKTS